MDADDLCFKMQKPMFLNELWGGPCPSDPSEDSYTMVMLMMVMVRR